MARTQLEASLGNDKSIYSQDTYPNVKHSSFNLSARYDMTCDPGMYFPVDWWFTLPGDHFKIQTRYILKSRPLVVAPFTPYHVRTHWFYCRLIDLWKGAPTWVTKGRSGNLRPDFPKFNPNGIFYAFGDGDPAVTFSTPHSLLSYLRLNPLYAPSGDSAAAGSQGYANIARVAPYSYISSNGGSYDFAVPTGYKLPNSLNALVPFMYQKCYRFDMTIPNLLQDSKVWFPDDISDGWRINYDKSNFGTPRNRSASPAHTADFFFHPTSNISSITCETLNRTPFSPTVNDRAVNILCLRSCLFEKDRFSTALPTNLRGAAPTADLSTDVTLNINGMSVSVPSTTVGFNALDGSQIAVTPAYPSSVSLPSGPSFSSANLTLVNPTAGSKTIDFVQPLTTNPVDGSVASGTATATAAGVKLNLNEFRQLIALTVWQERNMQTQGDYNSTIYAHFHVDPRHDDFEPKYIGGTSDTIYFDELVQDMPTNVQISGSNTERPAGSRSGLVDMQASGNVGDFTCPDYGFIMGIMFISPEVSYANGVERPWMYTSQEDLYFPEDEGLGLQEVLNYEIRASDSDSENNGLFGWQNRDTDMKSRQNRSLGWFAVPPSVDAEFSARSQSRIFTSTPNLSHNLFVESPHNLRRDWLAKPNDPAFELNYATILRGNRPMAYRSIPETFGF